jgi:hypothetical protein
VPAPGGTAGGVFAGDEPGEGHERARAEEASPVPDLGGDRERTQRSDAAVAAESADAIGEGRLGAGLFELRLDRVEVGLAGGDRCPVVRVGQAQRGLVEVLRGQPALVQPGPCRAGAVDAAVAQQETLESAPSALQIIQQVGAGSAQIPHRFLLRGGHPDRGQISRAMQPGQPLAVSAVSLDLVPGRAGDQRRGDHLTGDSAPGQGTS